MAFTGVPVLTLVADNICRITGLSLAGSANGTISKQEGTGQIKLPPQFEAEPYELFDTIVGLDSSMHVTVGAAGAGPAAGGENIAMFFGLTAGTGNVGPNDYAATVAVGAAVPFPQNGPTTGALVTRLTASTFRVNAAGQYRVSWSVGFLELSELQIAVNGVAVPNTTALSGAINQINSSTVLLTLAANDVVSLINPAGNGAALTVQTAGGGLTHAQAPNLVIEALAAESAPTVVKFGSDKTQWIATITNLSTTATGALEIYVKFHS